jgi:hypothetical protein
VDDLRSVKAIMARLDGKKNSSTPILIAVLVVAALALGAYYLSSRGQQNVSTADNPVPASSLNTATPTSDSEASNNAVSSNAASATPDATTTASGADATPGSTPEASSGADASPSGTTASDASSTPGSPAGTSNLANAAKNDVVAKRSKTIVTKNGTSVTYSKEVHRDGGVTKSKTTASTPVKP